MSLRSLVGILLFLVPTLTFSQNVTSCEFFWGTDDPGEGNGILFSAEDGAFDSAFETVLATSVEANATHGANVINVRLKDTNGNWGPVFKKVFFYEDAISESTTFNISTAEFYFGVIDPGEGNGTPLVAFDGEYDNAIENIFNSDISSSLDDGLTLFNIRLQDSNGNWGAVFRKSLFINQGTLESRDFHVREAEYYFGNIDPGAGNGTPLLAFDGNFNSAIESVFNDQIQWDLPQGEVLFNIRVKDSNYSWGPIFSKVLFIEQGSLESHTFSISSAEYFFGTIDTGEGSATPLLVFDGDFSSSVENLFAEGIDITFESDTILFNIRVQDGVGNWGPLFRKTLFLEQYDSIVQDFNITQAEYFIGIFDPGEGNGAPILSLDGSFDSAIENLLRSSLTWTQESGPTLFNIRVKDVFGNWGPLFKKTIFPYGSNPNANLVEVDSVWICPGDLVELGYSGPEGYEVQWFDGTVGDSIAFNCFEEGNYTLTATAGISVYTDYVHVGFVDYPIPQLNYEGEIPVCGSVINFTAEQFPNESYQWFFNDILINGSTSNNYLPTMLGEYYVEITNEETGCLTTSEPIIITNVIEINGGLETITSCVDQADLHANFGSNSTYTWFFEGVEIEGLGSNEITVFESGSYYVVVENDDCSYQSQTTEVVLLSELSSPEISSTGNSDICFGESVTLTSSTGNNIVWSTGEQTESITVYEPGEYYLTLVLNGCEVQSNVITIDQGVEGCTDPNSCNFDSSAQCDDGSCLYYDECGECGGVGVVGCTDSTACNYNPSATCNSGDCTYPEEIYLDCFGYCINDEDLDGVCDENEINGCMNPNACNYNSLATNDDNSCTFPGCTNPESCNYNSNAGCDNGSCLMFDGCGNCGGNDYPGCVIVTACNYDPGAGCNNGTCTFPGCTDLEACNYDPSAGCSDGSCTYPDAPYLQCNGFCINDEDFDGVCDEIEESDCTDPEACNYDENATDDDGSCWYAEDNYDCNGNCLNDSDGDSICDEFEIYGCTDPLACNYNVNATDYDGSCIYPEEYYDCFGDCLVDSDNDEICNELEIDGCADLSACNYDSNATDDDGSCWYAEEYYDCDGNCLNDLDGDSICDELEIPGCTDPIACNYDEEATDE
ncbi:MAG: hypothetical protein CL847_01125, partial [Crocinitomicaceae bacterium]|nr:hypothetical protein [Crocinitomicaceae bacterium]